MTAMEITRHGTAYRLFLPPLAGQHDYLELRQMVRQRFVEQGEAKLVIDCARLSRIPSIAFGVFCCIGRDARRAGGEAIFVHVDDEIDQVMRQIHVSDQIRILPTLADALSAMGIATEP